MKQKQETRLRDRSVFKLIRRMATERPMGIIGLVILVVLLFTALFANQLAPYGINQVDLMNMLKGSSAAHPMGTDNLGRDVFSNVIYGARVSVIIGFAATAVMLAIAVLIGTSSAVLGGAFDMVVQRFVDAWQCIPNMLVLMMAMSIVGRGTVQLIFAIGIPMASVPPAWCEARSSPCAPTSIWRQLTSSARPHGGSFTATLSPTLPPSSSSARPPRSVRSS